MLFSFEVHAIFVAKHCIAKNYQRNSCASDKRSRRPSLQLWYQVTFALSTRNTLQQWELLDMLACRETKARLTLWIRSNAPSSFFFAFSFFWYCRPFSCDTSYHRSLRCSRLQIWPFACFYIWSIWACHLRDRRSGREKVHVQVHSERTRSTFLHHTFQVWG